MFAKTKDVEVKVVFFYVNFLLAGFQKNMLKTLRLLKLLFRASESSCLFSPEEFEFYVLTPKIGNAYLNLTCWNLVPHEQPIFVAGQITIPTPLNTLENKNKKHLLVGKNHTKKIQKRSLDH